MDHDTGGIDFKPWIMSLRQLCVDVFNTKMYILRSTTIAFRGMIIRRPVFGPRFLIPVFPMIIIESTSSTFHVHLDSTLIRFSIMNFSPASAGGPALPPLLPAPTSSYQRSLSNLGFLPPRPFPFLSSPCVVSISPSHS